MDRRSELHELHVVHVALACALLVASTAARAQDPAGEPAPAPAPAAATAPDPFAGKSEDEVVAALRALETKLSLGEPLGDADKQLLVDAVRAGASPSVRALAAAVLPWLDPASSTGPLLAAVQDDDPRVRAQAAQSLVALSRRLDDAAKQDALAAGLALLDDPTDEAGCAGAELVAVLAPSTAADAIRARAATIGPVRYACFSRYAGLPQRRVKVPPLPEAPKKEPAPTPATPPEIVAPPPDEGGDGTALFVTTAAAAGTFAGALVPAMFFPPRDTLTYTQTTTRIGREEPSLFFLGASGLVGGAALGGAAYGLSLLVPHLDVAQAAEVALGTGMGGVGGVGVGLMIRLDDALAAGAIATGTLFGFGVSAATAHLFRPTRADVGFVAAVGGLSLLAGTLAAFTAIPVGLPVLFDRVERTDFALGVGLASGGTLGLAATMLTPIVDMPAGRVVATSAGAIAGASLGVAGGYLFTPAALDVRSRIASGVGVGGLLVGGGLAFFLVPDEWANAFAAKDGTVPTSLVARRADGWSLGVPLVHALAPPASLPTATALAAPLLGVEF